MFHAAPSFSANQSSSQVFGPMIGGGALYSAIVVTELFVLRSSLGLARPDSCDAILSSFAQYNFWQYVMDPTQAKNIQY